MYEQSAKGLGYVGPELQAGARCAVERPCSAALTRMDQETTRLGQIVEQLTTRLDSVLRPFNTIEKERTKPAPESALHGVLLEQCDRISAIASQLESTLGNLTV